jgi:outer membrane lipoprotein-sorting protein
MLGAVATWSSVSTSAWAFDLNALMTQLAKTKEGTASFVETRTVDGFDAPMKTRGELYFKAPDVFERRTIEPVRESLRVDGATMMLARGSQRRAMKLDAAPEAAAIVGAIRGTLTGDSKVLDEHFKVTLSGSLSSWLLDLAPRDAALAATVRQVQMRGAQGIVTGVEIWYASGDRSVMVIAPKP